MEEYTFNPCIGPSQFKFKVHSLVTPAMVQHLSVAIHGLSGRCLQLQASQKRVFGASDAYTDAYST